MTMITVITVMGAPGSKSSLAAGHHRGMLHGLRPTSPGAAGSVGAPAVSRVRTAWPESSPKAAGRASQAVPLRALDTSSASLPRRQAISSHSSQVRNVNVFPVTFEILSDDAPVTVVGLILAAQ